MKISKNKILEWIKRYGKAEIIGLLLGLFIANIIVFLTGNRIIAAFIATWTENLGFYGVITYNEYCLQQKSNKARYPLKRYWIIFRNLILEFGPSEYLDSFVIRPLYFSVFPLFIDNYTLAIFLGSIVANITYYIPTIIAYEVRKKYVED